MYRTKIQFTQAELDKITEYQLFRMQKDFRTMQLDRDAPTQQTRKLLTKQKYMIDQLEKEKIELINKIKSCQNPNLEKQDTKKLTQIAELIEENHKLNNQLMKERKEWKEVDKKSDEFRLKVQKMKVQYNLQDDPEVFKKIEKLEENLENRLYAVSVRYNNKLTKNAELRNEIDKMLKEREKFNYYFNDLMNKLNIGKRLVFEVTEQATWALVRRDEGLTLLNALRDRAKTDLKANCLEMTELKRTLHEEVKLFHFAGAKGAKRINVDIDRINYEKDLKKHGNVENALHYYQQILKNIKKGLGESNIGKLISVFLKREQDNYNIFSFINELNKEMEQVSLELIDYRKKIVEEKEKIKENEEKQDCELYSLEESLDKRTLDGDEAELKLEAQKNILQILLNGIQDIFNTIRCDPTYIEKLLGNNKIVSIFNAQVFLEIIEQRICDLTDLCFYLQYSPLAEKASKVFPDKVSTLKGEIYVNLPRRPTKYLQESQLLGKQPCPLCHEKEEISEVDDTVATPMMTEEIVEEVDLQMKMDEDFPLRCHNVSACKLPKSRLIVQKRNQN